MPSSKPCGTGGWSCMLLILSSQDANVAVLLYFCELFGQLNCKCFTFHRYVMKVLLAWTLYGTQSIKRRMWSLSFPVKVADTLDLNAWIVCVHPERKGLIGWMPNLYFHSFASKIAHQFAVFTMWHFLTVCSTNQ